MNNPTALVQKGKTCQNLRGNLTDEMFGDALAVGSDQREKAGPERFKDHADMDGRFGLCLVIKSVEKLDNILMAGVLVDRVDKAKNANLVAGSRGISGEG